MLLLLLLLLLLRVLPLLLPLLLLRMVLLLLLLLLVLLLSLLLLLLLLRLLLLLLLLRHRFVWSQGVSVPVVRHGGGKVCGGWLCSAFWAPNPTVRSREACRLLQISRNFCTTRITAPL